MTNITSRHYHVLSYHRDIHQFMIDVYENDWRKGVPASFLEYALCSAWMDKIYLQRNRIRFDGDRIAAFVFKDR